MTQEEVIDLIATAIEFSDDLKEKNFYYCAIHVFNTLETAAKDKR